MLGLRLDGSPEDAECLRRLAECWAVFEGWVRAAGLALERWAARDRAEKL